VTPFLPKYHRVKILRKLAYCAGVIAGYLALSFSRERDEQHDGPSGQRVVTSADESAASVGKRALHFSIAAAYFALRGVYRAVVGLLGRRRLPKRPVVITYHSIHGPDVPKFEEQMREVKRCATPITAMNLLDQSDDQTVAVTFDDGFSNVFDHAVPILAKHQVPATCFIPTGYIGREAGWMALRPPNGKPFRLESLASAERLAAADPRWITIGSHTVTHPHLTALDDTELDRELVESKGTLEEIVGKDVTSLSFPYGSFSGKVVASAVAAGYAQVFANVPVRAAVGSTPVLVGRIGVSAQDWPWEFRLKVLGAYEWLAVVIPIKRALLQRLRLRLS
jgi:peptidoglycan/xylan/chitin deacetylase (PgdA/CDA1 family)